MDSTALPRRFQLADVLALVASSGVALALVRYQLWMPTGLTASMTEGTARLDATYPPLGLRNLAVTLSLILAAYAPALLWMSLRQPRPPLRELVRSPGVWSCAVGTFAAWAYLGRHFVHEWRSGWPMRFDIPAMTNGATTLRYQLDFFPINIFPGLRAAVGPWIVITWLALIVLGRWRKGAGWIETSGRWLGASWILLYLTTLR